MRVRGTVPPDRLLAIPGVLDVDAGSGDHLEIAVEDPTRPKDDDDE